MVPLLLALCLPAQADVAVPPPTGKRFLTHALRVDGLEQHPGYVVVAFDGRPGSSIGTHRVFTAEAPQQDLAYGGSNRGPALAEPGLHLMKRDAYDAWNTEQSAVVAAQRKACSERGEGCAHISRFVPSYQAPGAVVDCGHRVGLETVGLATGPDTVIDVVTLTAASDSACTVKPVEREREKDGDQVGVTGCSAAALSATSVLAGLGLLLGMRRRR